MSNGLLYIAGLVALALAALFAVPHFIDWNGYRGVFEEEATRILGREVRVGGNVNVRLLPAPFVSFEKLRIADATGTTGEPFFRADAFTMRLSVPPLLKGVIEANEIELKRPVLNLALDAKGSGNWRSFSITPGTLPFVPADVTLQSVKIRDGVVAMHGPKGKEFAELDGLNGELKAETIEGPFSFKGTAKWKGEDRELRISTAAADVDGTIRFKATTRGTGAGSVYTVDGRIIDLKERPRIDGDVTAKLELDASQMPRVQTTFDAASAEKPIVDFKARMEGDADGLKLEDITMSFERVGQPQLITGSAWASWSDALKVELRLASRWLDLDRIAAAPDGADRPFETARSFVSSVMQALPDDAETNVRLDLDQANLGGDAVSGIRLDIARSKGALLLEGLRAGMPGGSKLALDGSVADVASARTFQGEFALRGTSLARFLKWAVKDKAVVDAVRSDGPFSLQGRLAMNDRSFDLTEAVAEIAGRPLGGEVRYGGGERKRLAVTLEGQEVDAAEIWPAGVGYLKDLVAGKAPESESDAAASGLRRVFDVGESDLALRVRVAKLLTGGEPLLDVDMDVAVEQGGLAMRRCRFVTKEGLELELEGTIADTKGVPHGDLKWIAAAPDKDAFNAFVRLLSLSETGTDDAQRYAGLAPMRLAGTIALGQRAKGTADLHADGTIQGGRVIASALLNGGIENWRKGHADLTFTLISPDVVQAFDNLTARSSIGAGRSQQRAGEIFFKAVGTPTAGMMSSTTVKANGFFFAYDGSIMLPAEGNRRFDGDVRVSARELGDVMALAGLGSGGALRGVPVVGTIKMLSTDHAIELKPDQLTVGQSKVGGSLALAYPGEGPAIVTAQLNVDKATIPGLMGVALDQRVVAGEAGADAAEPLAAGQSIWPESAFNFAALDGVEGKFSVAFGTLLLEPGMAIKKAHLDVALEPGKVSVTRLAGKALGGSVAAKFALERAPGGATVAGDVRFDDVHLERASARSGGKRKDATASVALEFSGRGATPGGLIAVATGAGEMSLGDMTMHVPTPLAVVETSEAVLSGAAGGTGDLLTEALRKKMTQTPVKVGPRKIAIEIADGAAKLAEFTLPSPAGRTRVSTTIDLASLVVDSTWILEPKAPDVELPDRARKGALPSVDIVYVGPLKDAWSLEPRISAAPLERELAIRKMELDAEHLERLHKLDAERAQREEQRRRVINEGRAADDVPAPAAPDPTGGSADPNAVERQNLSDPGVPEVPVDSMVGLPPRPNAAGTLAIPPPPGAPYAVETAPLPPATAPSAVDATGVPALDGTADPVAVPAPQEASAPRRRVYRRKQVPAGEQVLRALQNSTN